MALNIMGYALGLYHIYIYDIYEMRGEEATEQVTVGNSITKEA